MYNTWNYINIQEKKVVELIIDECQLFKREGKIGESLNVQNNTYSSVSETTQKASTHIKYLEESGFIKVDKAIHNIRFIVEISSLDSNFNEWDLLSLRDNIEEEIEEELIEKCIGEYVGSSGLEIVYDFWNFKYNVKIAVDILLTKLESNKISNFSVKINGKSLKSPTCMEVLSQLYICN